MPLVAIFSDPIKKSIFGHSEKPSPPAIEQPKVTEKPLAVQPETSPSAKPIPSFSPTPGNYVGLSSRIDTRTGKVLGEQRVWRIEVKDTGTIEKAYIYLRGKLFLTLAIHGAFKDLTTFIGRTELMGNTSYTPDDITITFRSDKKSATLKWSDPLIGREGTATLVLCSDTSTAAMTIKCANEDTSTSFDSFFSQFRSNTNSEKKKVQPKNNFFEMFR